MNKSKKNEFPKIVKAGSKTYEEIIEIVKSIKSEIDKSSSLEPNQNARIL